jgi:hypothetical protein
MMLLIMLIFSISTKSQKVEVLKEKKIFTSIQKLGKLFEAKIL